MESRQKCWSRSIYVSLLFFCNFAVPFKDRTLQKILYVLCFSVTLVAEQSIFWEAWQPVEGFLTPASGSDNKETSAVDTVLKDAESPVTTSDPKSKNKKTKTSSEERNESSDLREAGGSKETTSKRKTTESTILVKTSISTTKEPKTGSNGNGNSIKFCKQR